MLCPRCGSGGLFDHWRKTSTDHARGRAVDQPRREQPTVSIARIAGKLDLLERALDRLRDAYSSSYASNSLRDRRRGVQFGFVFVARLAASDSTPA
jgi:hypothetical protein